MTSGQLDQLGKCPGLESVSYNPLPIVFGQRFCLSACLLQSVVEQSQVRC
jgi:hypothetical protein